MDTLKYIFMGIIFWESNENCAFFFEIKEVPRHYTNMEAGLEDFPIPGLPNLLAQTSHKCTTTFTSGFFEVFCKL